jgi:hypothetical protein
MHDEFVDYKEEDEEYVRRTLKWDGEPSFHVDLDAAVLCEHERRVLFVFVLEGWRREYPSSCLPKLCSRALGRIASYAVPWYQG